MILSHHQHLRLPHPLRRRRPLGRRFEGYQTAKACGSEHPKAWGFASALAVGLAKEAYDKQHPKTHTCDPMDAAATFVGGLSFSFVWRF